jgi:hypothetical protein
MGDMTAYLKDEKLSIHESKLTPLELSEMIASIKNGTISGKIAKEVTFNYFFGVFYAFWTCNLVKACCVRTTLLGYMQYLPFDGALLLLHWL